MVWSVDSLAVPAIITQMDDFRPIYKRLYGFPNCNPDFWEGYAKYSPETVAAGLDTILPGMTDTYFPSQLEASIWGEGARPSGVDRWRMFLYLKADEYGAVRAGEATK